MPIHDLKNSFSKGFLTFAINNPYTDYIRLAYLQAMSIKLTQVNNAYAIVVPEGTIMPDKYKAVFDYVIDIPWGDLSKHQEWRLANEWKAIYASPFEATLKLDSDMLFFDDLSEQWEQCFDHELVPMVNALTYRGELVTSDYYRKAFTANRLPNVYSGLFYFRKTAKAYEFFKAAEVLFRHWDHFTKDLKDLGKETEPSTDIVYAVAAKVLGHTDTPDILRFTHMKTHVQNIDTEYVTEVWHEHLRHYVDHDLRLHIENFPQRAPFHYHVKEFATDTLISQYEKALGL